MAPPPREKYTSNDDKVIFEDESGRIILQGELLKKHHFVTGILYSSHWWSDLVGAIIGLLGRETTDGDFECLEICYAAAEQVPLPSLSEDKWVVLASGLNIAHSDSIDENLARLSGILTGEMLSEDVRLLLL